MESLKANRAKSNQNKRLIKLCLDLPEYDTYQVRFEKENKTNKKRVGLMCNKEKYTKDYIFNAKEPYLLSIISSFIGNICIEADGKETLRFPIIESSKEEITLALVQPKEKANNKNNSLEEKFNQLTQCDESYALVEIGTEYFSDLKEGTYKIQENMKDYFVGEKGFFSKDEVMSGVWGVPADIAQTIKDNIKFKVTFWQGILDLEFKIIQQNGKRFIVMIGLQGQEGLRKLAIVALTQGANTALVTAQKVNPHVNTMKTLFKGTWITTAIGSAISIYQADDKSFNNIVAIILGNFIKASASLLVGIIIAGFFIGGVAIIIGIGASLIASFLFNAWDHNDGLTSWIKEKLDELKKSFKFKIQTVEEGEKKSLEEFLDYLYRGLDYFIYTNGYSTSYSKPY